jgi:hypothetical protein
MVKKFLRIKRQNQRLRNFQGLRGKINNCEISIKSLRIVEKWIAKIE